MGTGILINSQCEFAFLPTICTTSLGLHSRAEQDGTRSNGVLSGCGDTLLMGNTLSVNWRGIACITFFPQQIPSADYSRLSRSAVACIKDNINLGSGLSRFSLISPKPGCLPKPISFAELQSL